MPAIINNTTINIINPLAIERTKEGVVSQERKSKPNASMIAPKIFVHSLTRYDLMTLIPIRLFC